MHRHKADRVSDALPFVGPVVADPVRQVPRAHGGVRYREGCGCGAFRHVNSNAGRRERGRWRKPGELVRYRWGTACGREQWVAELFRKIDGQLALVSTNWVTASRWPELRQWGAEDEAAVRAALAGAYPNAELANE